MSEPTTLGLASHISWALKIDEAQAIKVCEIVSQWSRMLSEGHMQFAACESPAERLFLLGALLQGKEGEPQLRISWSGALETNESSGKPSDMFLGFLKFGESEFMLYAQRDVAGHRVDFALESTDVEYGEPGFWGVAVEVDGHEFHEKTKAQASTDRERDRDVQREGYRILRYTGSDIYKSPASAVREVARFACLEEYRLKQLCEHAANEAIEQLTAPSASPPQLPPATTIESTAEAAE